MSTDEKIDHIMRKVDKIDRGVYGDPDNGVDGLIKENKDQEKRLKSLEDDGRKQKWMVAGFSFSVPVVVTLVREWLSK
jgi:hypothetical protein